MGLLFKDVAFFYDSNYKYSFAVKDINLKIKKENEKIAILGKTGSGKTTFLNLCNALLQPKKGEINILGINPKKHFVKLNPIRQKVALMFQFAEEQVFKENVLKDVAFGPSNFKHLKKDAIKLSKEALLSVGLDESFYKKSPFQLSGGEIRKVALAGILALNPDILLLDEPTRGLDLKSQNEIKNIIFKDDNKKSIIFTTHDIDFAFENADRIIIFDNAKIIYDGTKIDLLKLDLLNKLGFNNPKPYEIFKMIKDKYNLKKDEIIYEKNKLISFLNEVIL